MITLDEYIKKLDKIEAPEFAHLAEKLRFYLQKQKLYNIDLNSRKIEAPTFLSVKGDHEAQVICFTVDRFFENMDLAQDVTCVIQYINAKGDPYLYRVPFYDTYLLKEEGKLVLPWIIKDPVTIASGKIQFAFQFYKLDKDDSLSYQPIKLSENTYATGIYYYDNDAGERIIDDSKDFTLGRDYYEYTYKIKGYLFNLSTLPAYSQILHSLNIKNIPQPEYEYILIEKDLIDANHFISGMFFIKEGEDQYKPADSYIAGKDYYLKNKSPKPEQIHEIYADLTTLKNQLDKWDICWEEL